MDILAVRQLVMQEASPALVSLLRNVPMESMLRILDTWAYFDAKHLASNMSYYWSKIKVFTRWLPSTNQTGILLFDTSEDMLKSLFNPVLDQVNDPFWAYTRILEDVAHLDETTVWGIRNHVRGLETMSLPSGLKPQPDYRRLHDIARHAIHVTEALEMTAQNIEQIARQHETFVNSQTDLQAEPAHQEVSRRLAFFQSYIDSIRQRSISNEKRLQNEIQLAFNIVAQHDAGTTVEISRAARSDSATMKTLAFVTLTFLPPTFICAVFSMSFFHYDTGSGWGVSNRIWIYWVIAIPTTIATALVWNYWSKLFPGHSHGVQSKGSTKSLPKYVEGSFAMN
jgi:Mg2+ and Co2+ transporter CorA